MNPRSSPTRQLVAFDDEILIPPPRKAQVWYCNKCGEPGADVEPGMLMLDPRYAIGHCPCTKPRRNRVSGYKHELVPLTADFAWDQKAFDQKQEEHLEKLAYDKQMSGVALATADRVRAARYRARSGLPDPERI